jgi:peroxiredoxin
MTLFSWMAMCAVALAAAQVGQPAPDFTATDIHGKVVKLRDYLGKVVVLESYNLDCPFVANQYKSGAMQELQKETTDKGVIWLVVNSVNSKNPNHRTPEKARAEWDQQKMKATAWLDDSSGAIGKAYGMKTTPHMFVIAPSGTLVYAGAIDDQSSSSHDPRKARNYVRDAVRQTLAGQPVETSQTRPYGCGVKYGG